jgi:hypothetical protein
MTSPFDRQPLYAPLQPLLAQLSPHGMPPTLARLDALAAERGLRSGTGAPLRFVVPHGSGMSYEERIWWLGEVETRPGNWHDAFNALVWLSFPQTKAALNAAHHQSLAWQTQTGSARPHTPPHGRGARRDALTQFDECGAIVAARDLELWAALREHRWQEAFWQRRAELVAGLRVFIFGHASYDLLRAPHIGLCAKAAFIHVDDDWLACDPATQRADLDTRMALRFRGGPGERACYGQPRDFHPLPLLGIPGATAANESADYYADTRQFRPLRVIPH